MTYEGREIWARGLTNYMRGYTLKWSDFDGNYYSRVIEEVSYDEQYSVTVVDFTDGSEVELPHRQQVIIHG